MVRNFQGPVGTFVPLSELARERKVVIRCALSLLYCYYYFIATDGDVAATSSSRSSSARRQRLSGLRSGGTSRQPSEDEREEAAVAAGTQASATGEPHTGRYSRRTEGSSGRQLLSPSSVDDDESGQISPLQVNEKQLDLR